MTTKWLMHTDLSCVGRVGQVNLILIQPVVQNVPQLNLCVSQQRRLADVVSIHTPCAPAYTTEKISIPTSNCSQGHLQGRVGQCCGHGHQGWWCVRWRCLWCGRDFGDAGRGWGWFGWQHLFGLWPSSSSCGRGGTHSVATCNTATTAAPCSTDQARGFGFGSASLSWFSACWPPSPSPSVDACPGRSPGAWHVVGFFQSKVNGRAPFLAQNLHCFQKRLSVRRLSHVNRVQIILSDLLTHFQVVVAVIDERLRVVHEVQWTKPVLYDVVPLSHCWVRSRERKRNSAVSKLSQHWEKK